MLANLQRIPAKRIMIRLISRSRPYQRVCHPYLQQSRLRQHMTRRTKPSYRPYLCLKQPQETRLNLENPRFIYLTEKESLLKMQNLLTCQFLWKWAAACGLIKKMTAYLSWVRKKRVNQSSLWGIVSVFSDSSEATNQRDLKSLQVVSNHIFPYLIYKGLTLRYHKASSPKDKKQDAQKEEEDLVLTNMAFYTGLHLWEIIAPICCNSMCKLLIVCKTT